MPWIVRNVQHRILKNIWQKRVHEQKQRYQKCDEKQVERLFVVYEAYDGYRVFVISKMKVERSYNAIFLMKYHMSHCLLKSSPPVALICYLKEVESSPPVALICFLKEVEVSKKMMVNTRKNLILQRLIQQYACYLISSLSCLPPRSDFLLAEYY